jgi:hypothetical protein
MKYSCRNKQLYAAQEQKQGTNVIADMLGEIKSPAGQQNGHHRKAK